MWKHLRSNERQWSCILLWKLRLNERIVRLGGPRDHLAAVALLMWSFSVPAMWERDALKCCWSPSQLSQWPWECEMSGWFRGDYPAVSPLNLLHTHTPQTLWRRLWRPAGPKVRPGCPCWCGSRWVRKLWTSLTSEVAFPLRLGAKNTVDVLRAVAPGWSWRR